MSKNKKILINKDYIFVRIDIIDGFLTEINITSPTVFKKLIVWMV